MKQLQSYEDFEKALAIEKVPEIDLDRVKAKVYAVRKRQYRLKLALVLASALVLTLAVGVAAFNGWELKSDKGRSIVSYLQQDANWLKEDKKAEELFEKYSNEFEQLAASLGSNEAGIFIVTESYSKYNRSYMSYGDNKYYEINEIKAIAKDNIKLPSSLPRDLAFKEGTVIYETELSNMELSLLKEELYKKAKAEGLEYITKKIQISKEPNNINLSYRSTSGSAVLSVSKCPISMFSDIKNEKGEVLTLETGEVLIVEKGGENASIEHIFIKELGDQAYMYTIRTNNIRFNSEELSEIIGSLN